MKKETLEEAAEKYRKTTPNQMFGDELGFIDGAKWQQKRSYSEEDLKYAYEQGELYSYLCYGRTFENVLEIIKFKKK